MKVEDYSINLKSIRVSKGLTAPELSKKIGKSETYIAKIEKGESNVNLKVMIEIADALDTSIDDFLKCN